MALTNEEKDFITLALYEKRITPEINAQCRGDDAVARQIIADIRAQVNAEVTGLEFLINDTKQKWGIV